jgi:hypothetical protein
MGFEIKSEKVLVASTPEVLYSFFSNKLERDYFIYCQFERELLSRYVILSKAKGIQFQGDDAKN